MAPSVEEVSSSLVREYLSRKGLKKTIACMDEEHPRTHVSINNRSQLRQILNVEDLYKKNKVLHNPLKTLLELIVKQHIERIHNGKNPSGDYQQRVCTTSRPAGVPFIINGTKADEITPDLSCKKPIKLRPELKDIKSSQLTEKSVCLEEDIPNFVNPGTVDPSFSDFEKGQSLSAALKDKLQREADGKCSLAEVVQRSKPNRNRRGMMAGPVPQESSRKKQSGKSEVSQPLLQRKEEILLPQDGLFSSGTLQKCNPTEKSLEGMMNCHSTTEEPLSEDTYGKTQVIKVKLKPNTTELKFAEIVLDDIEDDVDLRDVALQRPMPQFKCEGCPMDKHIAAELKTVLLGSSLSCFSSEWKNQGFTFSETPDLRYGIVQKKGGPCGVLASIQAFVLKKLLFENNSACSSTHEKFRPSDSTRRHCLVSALTEVLWRAGGERRATVVIDSGARSFSPCRNYRSEGVLEKMMYFSVENIKDLQLILEQNIEQYENGTLGCLLLTVSAVLSRSIQRVREDMDISTATLIGAHSYCTQELVNLLLCGRAVSNVFDNEVELDSGSGHVTVLKGIKDQCEVGLLSLFEHYNICQVGDFLKTPSNPIWVVCSESHFSVLFGLQRELLSSQDSGLEFDLYYYDGLANQQEEICLTVSIGKLAQNSRKVDDDLIPPLELCIRTRWKNASVNWNKTEPIL